MVPAFISTPLGSAESVAQEGYSFAAASPAWGGPSHMTSGASLTLWPCDRSTRQRFQLYSSGIIHLLEETDHDERDEGASTKVKPVRLCMSNANNRNTGHAAQMIDCEADDWVGRWSLQASGRLELLNPPPNHHGDDYDDDTNAADDAGLARGKICLMANPRYSSLMAFVAGGGLPLDLAPCPADSAAGSATDSGSGDDEDEVPRWAWDEQTKALTLLAPFLPAALDRQCVTVGWPFVQAVAGVTPTGDTVTVVTNEASSEVRLTLRAEDGSSLVSAIPPLSLQTYVVGPFPA